MSHDHEPSKKEVKFHSVRPSLSELINPPKDNMDLGKGGVKFDADKVRLDLIPYEASYAMAAVLTYGAKKYEDWNWAKGMRKGRIVASLGRHMGAYMMGEDTDKESGLPHTWHAITCIAMLIGAELRGVAEEDRQIVPGGMEKLDEIFAQMNEPPKR